MCVCVCFLMKVLIVIKLIEIDIEYTRIYFIDCIIIYFVTNILSHPTFSPQLLLFLGIMWRMLNGRECTVSIWYSNELLEKRFFSVVEYLIPVEYGLQTCG